MDTIRRLFGKDADRLEDLMRQVMDDFLYPHRGCYRAEIWSKLSKLYVRNYSSALDKWYSEHPGEREKEALSRREWEEEHERKFRIIYGIAKRHGVYLVWQGDSSTAPCPDKWDVYKNNRRIARIVM